MMDRVHGHQVHSGYLVTAQGTQEVIRMWGLFAAMKLVATICMSAEKEAQRLRFHALNHKGELMVKRHHGLVQTPKHH